MLILVYQSTKEKTKKLDLMSDNQLALSTPKMMKIENAGVGVLFPKMGVILLNQKIYGIKKVLTLVQPMAPRSY